MNERTLVVRVDGQSIWRASAGGETANAGSAPGSTEANSLPQVLEQIGRALGVPTEGWIIPEESQTVHLGQVQPGAWSLRTLGIVFADFETSNERPQHAMSIAVRDSVVWRVAKFSGETLTLVPTSPREVWAQIIDVAVALPSE
jgi:hypothetical protein